MAELLVIANGIVMLSTDDKALDKGLADAKGKVSKTLDDIDKKAGASGTSFSQKVGGFLTGATFGAAVGFLGDAVQVARTAQVEQGRLEAAVDATGVSYRAVRGEIDRTIATLRHFGFTQQEVDSTLSLLVSETGSYTEALRRLPIAMDFARLRHIDLATAGKLLGRVSDENIKILSRYGVVVDKNATAEDVLAAVQAQSAGQAEKYAESAQGSADRFAAAWQDAQVKVGEAALNILGPVANVSQTLSGFGTNFTTAAGGIIGFAKAGKGSIPVLTGLRGAIGGVGTALKFLFLNPVGIAILVVLALVVGLKLLYDRVEPVRRVLDSLGQTLLHLVPGLQWVMDRLHDVGAAMGLVGDDSQGMSDDIASSAAAARTSIRSIGDELADLNKMFKPAAADKTEEFLKALGADPDLINQALDALYNTVGGDQASRFKKITDIAYKQLTEEADKGILQEAQDNLKAATDASEAELAHLAKVAGASSPKAYIAQLKQQLVDAEKVAEHYNAQIAKSIIDAREAGQTELDTGTRMTAHLSQIDKIQQGWDNARASADYYYRGVLSQGFPGAPKTKTGPNDVAPFAGGIVTSPAAGGSGGQLMSVVINQDLNYSGDTGAMAADAAGEVVDGVTEALRQQQRRLSNVSTV